MVIIKYDLSNNSCMKYIKVPQTTLAADAHLLTWQQC
jgi:hypothetical protein